MRLPWADLLRSTIRTSADGEVCTHCCERSVRENTWELDGALIRFSARRHACDKMQPCRPALNCDLPLACNELRQDLKTLCYYQTPSALTKDLDRNGRQATPSEHERLSTQCDGAGVARAEDNRRLAGPLGSPSINSPAEPASTTTHSLEGWSYQNPGGLACFQPCSGDVWKRTQWAHAAP